MIPFEYLPDVVIAPLLITDTVPPLPTAPPRPPAPTVMAALGKNPITLLALPRSPSPSPSPPPPPPPMLCAITPDAPSSALVPVDPVENWVKVGVGCWEGRVSRQACDSREGRCSSEC